MSLILLGILNSQVSPAAAGAYDLLESTVLTSSASSVTFTGLGSYSDYKHLQLRFIARSDRALATTGNALNFNSDTGTNYANHFLTGNGSSVASDDGGGASRSSIALPNIASATETANIFSPSIVDILDFSSTNKNTTIRGLGGSAASSNLIRLFSGLYISTSAITSFTLTPYLSNYVAGSRFSLYGVK